MRWHDLFPAEVVHDIPRVTLTGCTDVLVEQHHGLVVYREDEIIFSTASGQLRINGEHLGFATYSAVNAQIRGKIFSIALDHSQEARS